MALVVSLLMGLVLIFFIITVITLFFTYWYITFPAVALIIIYKKRKSIWKSNRYRTSSYSKQHYYSKTELLKSRLKIFDLSEDEAELLFGKKWRDKLGSWNYDLFYKIVQMKLDLTDPSKSFRKKVSHIIDKVIRIIDSVWIEYPQEVTQFKKICNDQTPGGSDWIEREWEFFKKHKKSSSEFSENTLDASEAYEILGLSMTVTLDQVKERFRELALRWHPDKNDSAIKKECERKFVRINQAYETIMGAA